MFASMGAKVDDKPQYRATHYNYKAWQIEQLVIPSEDAKNQEPYWRIIKYPGSLQNAVNGLLDLFAGDFTIQAVNDVQTALNTAETKIMDALNELFVSRDNET